MVSVQKLDREAFAAAAWTTIVEPGDEMAALLRLTLGASESLEALIRRDSATALAKRVLDTEYSDLAITRFARLTASLEDSFERWLPRLNKTTVENSLKVAAACGATFIHPEDETWPSALSDLGLGMPAGLWVRGELVGLAPAVAIVGSRTATPYGAWVCAEFVGALQDKGVSLVSGGAFGIDAAAHSAAVNLGAPNFAVMAGGVDQFYPSSNSELLRSVAGLGAVMSELPPGTRPTRWRFLQRNRIIAALGRATLVVEAGHRSGAINTANHALAIGRPVGAVPGQVNRSTSDGCHRLIRESFATLISSAGDLLELIGLSATNVEGFESLGALDLRALDALTLRFQNQHSILNKAGLTSLELAIAMGSLELAGLAERNEQGYWRKTLNL